MSTEERGTTLKATFDATGVRKGSQDAVGAVRQMASDITAEAGKAAAGLERVGAGGERSADAVERDTRRMVQSLERATAAAQSGGRQTSAYFEVLAKQRGLDPATIAPYIAELRKVEAAQARVAAGLGGMELSAKATTAALRQVPAQFTDIVTSLAAGQAPLTVLLQQGGQLKDVFGGAGAAARALGGYILGLINPITVTVAAAAGLAVAFEAGAREASNFGRALIQSGNAAGTTAGQLGQIASAVAKATGATQGRTSEVLLEIAASGEVAAGSLQRYTAAAIALERAGGPAAEETAKAFAELGREPLKASEKLTQSTRYLTAATFEQIKTLTEQGRTVEAARVAQEAYARSIDERAPQMERQLGLVERAWRRIKDEAKGAVDAILNIGRGDETRKQIELLEAQLKVNAEQRPGAGQIGQEAIDRGNQKLVARLRLLQQGIGYEQLSGALQAEIVKQQEAGIRWLKEGEKYLSAQQKAALELKNELLSIENVGRAAGVSQEQINERIALAKQRYAERAGEQKKANKELEQEAKLLAELAGLSSTYLEDLNALERSRKRGALAEAEYVTAVEALIARQPFARKAAQDAAEQAREEAREVQRATAARAKYLDGLDDELGRGDKHLQSLRDELVLMTQGKAVLKDIVALRLEEQAVLLERDLIALQQADPRLDEAERQRLQRRIDQLREQARIQREIATATDADEVRKANERAAREAAAEWSRTADQISNALAAALLDGGKAGANSLKALFRSLVLRPAVELLRPGIDALGDVLGLGGSRQAGSGGDKSRDIANSIKSALGPELSQSIGALGKGISQAVTIAMIGRSVGQAISGGYSVSGSPNRAVNTGLALLGPIGAVVGGVINRLFGRKLADTGFEGSFGAGGDFTGNSFEFLKGGLFRSDKTNRGTLDGGLESVLDAGGKAAFSTASAYVDAIGLPVEALANYSKSIKVSLKDLSEDQARDAVTKAVQDFQEGLIGRFSAQLEPLRRTGETLTQVAERLASLQTFSKSLNELGGVFSRVAALSVDARENLIELAGGMENLTQQALGFVQQYFGREEIAGIKAREIQAVLSAVGINQDISTKEQFRAIVDAVDVTSEAGRQQLAQLLRVATDFADVASFLGETGGTLSSAALLAPQSGVIPALFAQPDQAQIDAINGVGSGVNAVREAIEDLIDVVRGGFGSGPVYLAGEGP